VQSWQPERRTRTGDELPRVVASRDRLAAGAHAAAEHRAWCVWGVSIQGPNIEDNDLTHTIAQSYARSRVWLGGVMEHCQGGTSEWT